MSTIAAPIAPKLLELNTSNLVRDFVWGLLSWRTNNFPWKWAWPRSRDPYNFVAYDRTYLQNYSS